MHRALVVALVPFLAWSCNIVGPSCTSRQQRGTVASLSGEVGPGQMTVHQVPYGSQGSQNDIAISYTGNPRIQVYATRAGCASFSTPPPAGDSECAVLAIGTRSLIITHGRGNPAGLGSPPEYRLWVVNDGPDTVRYSITTAYFYGPDC